MCNPCSLGWNHQVWVVTPNHLWGGIGNVRVLIPGSDKLSSGDWVVQLLTLSYSLCASIIWGDS